MDNASAEGRTNARWRYAVDFSVDGDIRFISHNDSMRMFARACARAGLPLWFTRGFNPRARISLPLPRPVGQRSDVERLVVDLTQPIAKERLIERLAPQLPAGVTVRGAKRIDEKSSCQPAWVRYRVSLPQPDLAAAKRRIAELLGSDSVLITRVRHKDGKSKVTDIRPFIDTIHFDHEDLTVSVFITESGTTSALEVCQALDMSADIGQHHVRRVMIRWQEKPATPLKKQPQP